MKLIYALILVTILSSCRVQDKKNVTPKEKFLLSPGTWNMTFDIANNKNPIDKITVRFEVDSSQNITFVNNTERIKIDDVRLLGDSILIVPKQFNSQFKGARISPIKFSGNWFNFNKKDYSIPFIAEKINDAFLTYNSADFDENKYAVTFSPNTSDEYQAVGIFYFSKDKKEQYCYGTFLTETGDYRFLEGQNIDNHLVLSCFDGSHLFTFTGKIQGDSLVNGTFNSGKHWYEPWVAKKNSTAHLHDPNTLTYLKDGYETIDINVQNLNGDTLHFNKDYYKGKVNIVTVMGTWCPNCLDEAKYFTELFMKYNAKGLNVLPVCFEISDDFTKNIQGMKRFFGFNHIPFQPYYGGQAGKSNAAKKFYMLNTIMSYPTSIFIDKKGVVRKIHTGFYGPGTGQYYENYKRETDAFVKMLLEE